jgi:CBS domain containing-hemolysin-like protein
MPHLATILALLSVPLLVALNAFFVAAEFALVAVRKTRVEEMVNHRWVGALAVREAVNHLDDAIAATQLGITLASLALGWIGEPVVVKIVSPLLTWMPEPGRFYTKHGISIGVAFTLITFLHVILGELAPKAIALQRPDRIALLVSRPLLLFSRIMRPFIFVMNGLGNLVVRLLGFEPVAGHQMLHSVDELALLIEETRRAGVLPRDQAEYVHNVFRLPEKKVRDCLVPHERMACLEIHMPEGKVLDAVREGAHTRMPVLDRDTGEIVGIVNTKDLFYLFSVRGAVVLDDAMYPPTFVDPDRPISEVLRHFRRTRRPMAIVRDRAGQILGMITLEDIIEEIVGEIEDEHDLPPRYKPLP